MTSYSSTTAPKLHRTPVSNEFLEARGTRTSNIPVTSDPGEQVGLEVLKVGGAQGADPLVLHDHHPCLDGSDLAIVDAWQLSAQRQKLAQIRTSKLRHLVRIWLAWLLHDMADRRAGSHERMSGHVLVIRIVCGFHRVMVWLTGGVVRPDDEVLHVLHARTFEAAQEVALANEQPSLGLGFPALCNCAVDLY